RRREICRASFSTRTTRRKARTASSISSPDPAEAAESVPLDETGRRRALGTRNGPRLLPRALTFREPPWTPESVVPSRERLRGSLARSRAHVPSAGRRRGRPLQKDKRPPANDAVQRRVH